MSNPVVHFEILGPDAAALQQYYRDLFDWSIDGDNPMSYGIVAGGDGGIGGGIGPSQTGAAQVAVYVQVEDLAAALARAERLGGRTVAPPMEVPGGPTIAQFADPAGNVVGLVKS